MCTRLAGYVFFFFNDTATTEIYTLSLHDALPISVLPHLPEKALSRTEQEARPHKTIDRKSTRLNSSHSQISYAVFCLKKKRREAPVPYEAAVFKLVPYWFSHRCAPGRQSVVT